MPVEFRHADETGVGQGHRHVAVAAHELEKFGDVIFQRKGDFDDFLLHQLQHRDRRTTEPTHNVTGFRKNRFASHQGWPCLSELLLRPSVMAIILD